MTARHAAALKELAELGMVVARDLQVRVLAAETPEQAAGLTGAFHRAARTVRQSMALEAKLARDAVRDGREARAEAEAEVRARVDRRKSHVRTVVERMVWSEREGAEAERLVDWLADLVTEDALADNFMTTPVEALVARLRYDLGLSKAAPEAATADGTPEGGEGATPPVAPAPDPGGWVGTNVGPADPWPAQAFKPNSS